MKLNNVYAIDNTQFDSLEFDLSKAKVGDVYRKYQNIENNEYV